MSPFRASQPPNASQLPILEPLISPPYEEVISVEPGSLYFVSGETIVPPPKPKIEDIKFTRSYPGCPLSQCEDCKSSTYDVRLRPGLSGMIANKFNLALTFVLCNACHQKLIKEIRRSTRYFGVTYDCSAKRVTAKTTLGFKGLVEFTIDVRRFGISVATDLDHSAIPVFMRLSDKECARSRVDWAQGGFIGYSNPTDYDFRDIDVINSSDRAVDEMFVAAQKIIREQRGRLWRWGFPSELRRELADRFGPNA